MKDRIRLVDVGARGGLRERWLPFLGQIDVMAFEPDRKECAALNSRSYPYAIRFLPAALGAEDGQEATLYLCRQPGCSSLLRPDAALCAKYPYGGAMEVVGEHRLTLQRMDTVCGEFQPDVLKIDTQGTELDILVGAGRLLGDVLAIELEVEFVPIYVGQALFAEVDIFLRQQGFTLRGLRRTYWRTSADQVHSDGGQLVHGDALYLRPERLDCPKGHAILAAYRQFDLLASFGAAHLVPRKSWLTRVASRLLAGFTNKELRSLADRIRPDAATDWHDPEFF